MYKCLRWLRHASFALWSGFQRSAAASLKRALPGVLPGLILVVLAGGGRLSAAVPIVNGQFYGDGDEHKYVLYNTSIGGSKLWYTFADNRIYVALVVDRSVNDNVFGNRDYTRNAGWSPPHPANRLVDSEYAQFTLTVGSTTFQWNQGYGALVGGVWKSDHTTGAGSGTPPAGYVSSSSFAWNINNYEMNTAPNWNMYVNGSGINNWKSPFDANAPNVAVGLEGYPATGPITYSPYYQWEWPMVYEWSADLSSFGPDPVFVISAQSHHSPAKSGGQDDYFQPPPGGGYLTDYGDLPAPYPTLLTHDGARHYIVPNGARLGTYADPEPDGVPDALARGDDLSGFDDEDGVELLTPLVPGSNAVLRVTAATPGYLSAFIDWTGSGTLSAMTLLSATGPTALTPGTIGDMALTNGVYELTVAVPSDAAGSMASRFRYTNLAGQGGNSSTGLATTGEVEDYIFTATIGNRVWQDTNKDGIQDDGEPGLAGVSVTLFTSDNVAVATTVTDSQGLYLFEDVLPGAYYVQVDALPGYVFSPPNAGGDAALDSDADAAGIMPVTLLYPGESDLTWDAGLYATGSIGDTIFYDWNGNGTQDPGESGLPGVTVNLYDSANELIASANTDANGFYLFDSLTAGTYRVEVGAGVPSGYTLTSDPDGVLDGMHTVTLTADQIYLAADFGYQPIGSGSIGDTVFEDRDDDGVFNNLDVGIDGVTLELYFDVDGNGVLDASDLLIATTVTSDGGTYLFDKLDPNLDYLVRVQDGSASGVDDYFTTVYTLTTLSALLSVTPSDFLAQGGTVTTADFGYLAPEPATISGYVFEDLDNDGLLNNDDIPLPDVTVYLYQLDDLGNRVLVDQRETDGNGYYEFAGLMPGNYVVVVASGDPDLPAGQATALPEYFVLLASGETVANLDFPFVPLLSKTVDKSVAQPKDTLAYTLVVNPPASGALQDVILSDPLPPGTTFVSASHGGVFANGSVSWELGSTVPGFQGTLTTRPKLYAFRGGETESFWEYDQNTATWSSLENFGSPVGGGGSLTFTGTDIFGLAGGASQTFRRFNIYTATEDTWIDRTALGAATEVDEGGALTHLNGMIYALSGNNTTTFRRYNIATDTWTAAADAPATVGRGGRLANDGTYVYALRGNNSDALWRYDPVADQWQTLAAAPAQIGMAGAAPTLGGAAMAHDRGNLYALRGDGTTAFWRYNIASDTWSSTTVSGAPMTQPPHPVSQGGAMVLRSVRFYVLFGNGSAFGRYNIAENTWTMLPSAPEAVMSGGALVTVGSVATRETEMIAAPYAVRTGDIITVTVSMSACGFCPSDTNLQPPALTVTAAGGASANLIDGPLPAPQNIPTATTRYYYYRYSVTAGTSDTPQSLTFSIPSSFTTGDLPSVYPSASANSVIVVPDFTLTVAVDESFVVGTVTNQAQFFGAVPSAGGACYVLSDSTSCGDGEARLLRIDSSGVTDIGLTGTDNAGALAWAPDASRLYTADGNLFGYLDINTGAFTAIGPIVLSAGSSDDQALEGEAGNLAADAVRVTALAFAPNGTLFAILRRDGAPDLLFQIDPLTGRHVEDAFGTDLDYRVILATSGREDIEALAFHPSGTLFAVAANTGTPGDGDLLVTIPDPAAAAGTVQPAGVANALSPAGLLWIDADESGAFLAGEELFDVRGLSITSAGSARIVTGGNAPANFEDSLFSLDLGSAQASWSLTPSGACNYQDAACSDARVFSAADQVLTDVFVPAVLEGYLFRDENGDLLRNSGDTTITNAAVRLVVNGVLTATVFTDETGYYRFEDVPPGLVSILVSRINASLIAVPDQEPDANDPTRNRALPDGDDAVIEYQVTSGYGVLAGNPSETLNFGFSVHPLSAVLDIQLYAMADGRVRIDIWTQDESGSGPIVVLALINGLWTEVGRIQAEDVYGTGSRLYTLYTDKLAADSAYYIRVIDEAGFIHESFAPLPVTTIRLAALRLSMQQIELEFTTEYGRRYQVQTSTNLREWSAELARYPLATGWSELSRLPFMAGPGDRTRVLVPKNGRIRAYFRIVAVDF